MNTEEMARLIQMAVAPIFLLSAVAISLQVFSNRLARIVDRGRALESRPSPDDATRSELRALESRARMIYQALCFGVSAAILVSLLMALAFAGLLFHFEPARAVAFLFMTALFAYTGALMCLLREVFVAVGSFRLGVSAYAGDDR